MNERYQPTRTDKATRKAFEALLALPRSLRHRAAGKPHIVDGGALDPDIALGLKILGRMDDKELDERKVPDAREALAAESWIFDGTPAEVKSVDDVAISGPDGDIPALLYRPKPNPVNVVGKHAATAQRDERLPLVVYYHGGGWVLGSHHTHDGVCRNLCAGADVVVLNVDYRLAPEHVFPAAVDDAVAAFRWAHDHADELGIDPNRIAVAGDSAGGNLAAVVAQVTAREGGPTPALQVLFVPATDMTMPRSRSYELFKDGYLLTQANMDWFEANYLGGGQLPNNIDELRTDPRVSPLKADDVEELAAQGRLAPAYVAVAGFDPLRDEGIAYANRLKDAGVPTTLRVHDDAVHPFIGIGATDLGKRTMVEATSALRSLL